MNKRASTHDPRVAADLKSLEKIDKRDAQDWEQRAFEHRTFDKDIRVKVLDSWQNFADSVFSLTPESYVQARKRRFSKTDSVLATKFLIEVSEPLPTKLMLYELRKCVRQVKKKVRS